MVATQSDAKARVIALLDELPESALAEIATFIEYQRYRLTIQANAVKRTTPYIPTPLGGLFKGVSITDEDIRAARKEMWGEWVGDPE